MILVPLLVAVAAVLVVCGVALWSVPAGVVTAGVALAAWTVVFLYDWEG